MAPDREPHALGSNQDNPLRRHGGQLSPSVCEYSDAFLRLNFLTTGSLIVSAEHLLASVSDGFCEIETDSLSVSLDSVDGWIGVLLIGVGRFMENLAASRGVP